MRDERDSARVEGLTWDGWPGRLSEKVTWELRKRPGSHRRIWGRKGLQAEQAASAKVGSQEQIGLGSKESLGMNETVV